MSNLAGMAGDGAMAANPELAVIPIVTSTIQKFGGYGIMIPAYILSIILIIIGIILLSADKSKLPGVMVTFLGFFIGAGAFYFSRKFVSDSAAVELAKARKGQ